MRPRSAPVGCALAAQRFASLTKERGERATYMLFGGRRAVMRGVRCVGGGIGKHRVDRRDKWLEAYQTGKDGFVANRIPKDE